jgi:predicted nucleic acid-binding protein
MIVVANTSPICYLQLIGQLDLLPGLFGQILAPDAVRDELTHERAPSAVHELMQEPPSWLIFRSVAAQPDLGLEKLHAGERAAILLAQALRADLIILDEKAARQIAAGRGLRVTGLLGILDEAATRDLIDLPAAVDRLRQTTFRAPPRLLEALVQRHQPHSS